MRPETCRHDPGCGSEMACIARGTYEGESYRRQADKRERDEIDERYWAAVKRGVVALERIADAIARISPEPSAEERAARARLDAMRKGTR